MIQMIALEVPEVAIARLSEMQEIMEPLFADIALDDTGKQGGERVNGKEEAEGGGYCKERQDILQLAADVPAVKRPLMVFPMKRVEPLVKKAANQAFAGRKAAVENVTMEEIFHQAPHRDGCEEKSHTGPWVPAAQIKQSHDQRVRCVESRQRIEPPTRDTGLFAFVGFERTFDRTRAR
jgi:hypothetical protein